MRSLLLICALILTWLSLGVAATDFDALTTRENCNRSESPLSNSGQWSQPMLTTNTTVWDANGSQCLRDTSPTQASAWWNVETFGPDAAIALTIPDATSTATGFVGLWLRVSSPGSASATDGYLCFFNPFLNTLEVNRYTDSVWADGTDCTPSASIDDGDRLACEVIGSTIKAYVKRGSTWQEECTFTDSTYPNAGYVGIQINTINYRVDDIQFDTLEAEAAPTAREGLMPVIP